MISPANDKQYGGKIRTRVCGLILRDEKILLLNHTGLNKQNTFWSPPGGGIEFGESIEETLKRELKEETNLTIKVGNFLFVNEHIVPPLHAIELFYSIESEDIPRLGNDPEIENSIQNIKWFSQKDIDLVPNQLKHSMFVQNPSVIQYIIEKR